MFILGNLLSALAVILEWALIVIFWLIVARALVSWVNPDPLNPIVQFLEKTTEPILGPIRRKIPLNWRMGIDVSPLIAALVIVFLQKFLVQSIVDLAYRLKY
jgi:YggT family protein